MGSDAVKVADSWLMDSCKMAWHPCWLDKWLQGKMPVPIYAEIGLTNHCQHRCVFCSFDYSGYRQGHINDSVLKRTLTSMANIGVKSVMFAGEGEPFLHPQIVEITRTAKKVGLNIAITTNGHNATPDKLCEMLPWLTWLKFSINGGTSISHGKLHGTGEESFDKVIRNLQYAASQKGHCTVGVQSVLLPEYEQNIIELAQRLKQIGVDYYTVKPFTAHPLREFNQIPYYTKQNNLFDRLRQLSTPDFQVIIREQAFWNLTHDREYDRCYGIEAMTYVAATGDVYACSNFLGKPEYSYGNINEQSFREIWQSEKRQKVMERINRTKLTDCRLICRLDLVNQYLWKMKHPPAHVNFI